jgi:two-component system CheB/CheR fusion protein
MVEPVADQSFEELLEYLRAARGFDFTGYKRSSLIRRVTKRMQLVGVEDFARYLDYLQVHQEEFTELFNFILINVSPSSAIHPSGTTWPGRSSRGSRSAGRADSSIRIWCAGCAGGEEAYSIAMLFAERLGEEVFQEEVFQERVKIYATDADEEAIVAARHGVYGPKALEPVDPGRRDRLFELSGEALAFRRDLRRSLIFGRHDLVRDAPISKTDLISCRNTLMYLNADTQGRVLEHFRFSLRANGFLVLGKSEMLFTRIRAFEPVDLKRRVFAKEPGEGEAQDTFGLWGDGQEPKSEDAGGLAALAAEEAPMALVLVGDGRRVLIANRRARELFALREDDVGRPLADLELSYRPVELRGPIDEAESTRRPVQLRGVPFRAAGGGTVMLNVGIVPLEGHDGPQGVAVSFVDVSEAQHLQQDLENSNQELETAMEELQSTNEELETMNEELQSTNEELSTVNLELGERTQELASLNVFMTSVLGGVRAGVVVLDGELRVRIWNPRSEDLWGLREDEVRGRSFLGLDIGLPLEPIREQIHRTMAQDVDHHTIALDARDRRGRAVRCLVTASRFADRAGEAGVILLVETEETPA